MFIAGCVLRISQLEIDALAMCSTTYSCLSTSSVCLKESSADDNKNMQNYPACNELRVKPRSIQFN